MTKEELNKLNNWIMNLSEEERKKRRLYLRKLSLGEIQGPPVGYASIDMPWLKCYDEVKYKIDFPKEIFYEGLYRQNKDYLSNIAINYFYTNISFKKLFERINSLVKALSYYGIKDGDYVSVCMPGIPESMYAVNAFSYIGAVGIFLPPYLDKKTMLADVSKNKSKIMIITDIFYEKNKSVFDEVIDESGIEKVIIVPILNSSVLNVFQKKKGLLNEKFIYYNDFIKEGKDEKMPEMAKYYFNRPLAVVYSSGTTGILKGVLLSNDSFVNSAASYTAFGFDLSRGQKIYQAIPVWSSTGLIADGTTALYYGCTLYQNPKFEADVYSKNLGKYKINWGIATTELFNGLLNLSEDKFFMLLVKLGIVDYKQITHAYIGGTLSTKNDKDKLDLAIKKLGGNAKIRGSYGTCENGSIVTAELNGYEYPEHSVGIPIPGVNIMCIDENENEVPLGERGEIAVCTKCGMINYYNRPDLNHIFFSDGKDIFKHTGDMGRITKDGVLLYEGRLNDFSIIDSQKIYNFDIKNTILSKNTIYDCEVFTNDDGIFCAHIIFKYEISNIDDELSNIQKMIYEKFGLDCYVPKYFKIRKSFPMASSTKRDYKLLKSETDDFIYHEFYNGKQLTKDIK